MSISSKPEIYSPGQVIRSGLCIGCGNCVSASKVNAAHMDLDAYGQYKPTGDVIWLNQKSSGFSSICPFSPAASDEDELAAALYPTAPSLDERIGRFEAAYVGHVAEEGFRDRGSSGGMVSWVLAELLRRDLIDGAAHVIPVANPQDENRFFRYRVSRELEDIFAGAKSRYYPVEMSAILEEIRTIPGRYAVVGVPCFIKAINLLRRHDPIIRERVVFTLGLFCGHMKSARLIESYALQMGVDPAQITAAEFRIKDSTRPASTYTAQFTLTNGEQVRKDWWFLAEGDWGSGYFQNSACNFCDDVVAETADISFGDAWVEPYSSDGRGTNVVVVRTTQLSQIVSAAIVESRLHLEPVDAAFVAETQAAGFRQRREGLAYRLTWPRAGVRPRKRVVPSANHLSTRRKLIYRMRAHISKWSHVMFRFSRRISRLGIYTRWAWTAQSVYHALAYSRGTVGKLLDRFRFLH